MNNYPGIPWVPSQLHGKTVSFELISQGVRVAGRGTLSVIADDVGILSIQIKATRFTKPPVVHWEHRELTPEEAMHLNKSISGDFDFVLFSR
jgi:hypothetical protein